jgi:hypothetical protein
MRHRPHREVVLAAAMLAAIATTAPARGQTPAPANSNVAAEALFEDARALVAAGKYAEACPKFADSQRLGPSVATQLNLANCYEKLGRTASAWATYREAASAANAAGRKDYLATALRRADGLAPKLARLTVNVPQPTAGLQVKRDGVVIDQAEWGAAIPVDTGTHTVEAGAAGHKSWSTSVEVAQDGTAFAVAVPVLEEAPGEPGPAAAPGVATGPSAPSPSPLVTTPSHEAPAPATGNGQRVIGAIVGGVGIATLAAGGIVALVAKNKYDGSIDHCQTGDKNSCDLAGVNERNSARTAGDVATVLLSAGGAVLVAGGIIFLTAPHGAPTTGIQLLPTLGGVVARGAF